MAMLPRQGTQSTVESYPAEERERILAQVRKVAESHFFRNSKRYPEFLAYIVNKTIDGRSDELKERTLGIEIFGRSPAYDTSGDSIVRVAAAEVRKRLTQYYREQAAPFELIIELPAGSYIPSFKHPVADRDLPRSALDAPESTNGAPLHRVDDATPARGVVLHPVEKPAFKQFGVAFIGFAAGILLAVIAVFFMNRQDHRAVPYFDAFVGTGTERVLVCVGAPALSENQPPSEDKSLLNSLGQPVENNVLIPFSDVRAVNIVTALLDQVGRTSRVSLARDCTFSELMLGPAVVVGALDNPWTQRLTRETPFVFTGSDGSVASLVSRDQPAKVFGTVDFSVPYSGRTQDFGVLSLFASDTLHQPTALIAGIGPNGTMAAAELLSDSRRLQQVLKDHPRKKHETNLSIVLATQVIQGQAGFPRIIDVRYW